MLNKNLLLDSASAFSNYRNIRFGCPEHSSEGVLSSCLTVPEAAESESSSCSWYVLRVTYSRELKIKAMLDEKGVKTFIPMTWRNKIVDGKIKKQLEPAVNNLCFVYWTKPGIDSFIRSFSDASPVHYYWDRTKNSPLTVPDDAMEDFIIVASSLDEDLVYMTEINSKLREGQLVKVKSGAFVGVTGRVVRIKKSRRVMIELPGMLAVATTHVKPENLDII